MFVECDGPRRFVLARTLHVEPFQETRKQCPQQALNDVIPTTTCSVEKLRRDTQAFRSCLSLSPFSPLPALLTFLYTLVTVLCAYIINEDYK